MTQWAVAGVTAAVALALAGVVWLVRRRDGGQIDGPEAAAAAVEGAIGDFRAHNAVVGSDWRAALVVAEDGRVAVVKARRAGLTVREVPWHAVVATSAGIVVDTGARRLGRVPIAGIDTLDVRRLAPAGANWRRR